MRSVRVFYSLDLIKVLIFVRCKKFTRLRQWLQATAAEKGQQNLAKGIWCKLVNCSTCNLVLKVHRKQQVIVEGESSMPCSVDSEVPQGSVKGPLLFLYHINDLPQRVTSKVRLFADDYLLYRPIHTPRDQLLLQQELAAIETWAEYWCMRFNVSKCYLMSILRSKHPYSSHYKLDNHILEQVEENPYLGVTMHKSPKWASHINKIYNKANYILGFIQRNLKHANRDLREVAYTLLVRSILGCSSTAWDPFYQKAIDRLKRVQRRAARFVPNDNKPLSSVTSMVSQRGWKPLAERRREHCLSLLY